MTSVRFTAESIVIGWIARIAQTCRSAVPEEVRSRILPAQRVLLQPDTAYSEQRLSQARRACAVPQ